MDDLLDRLDDLSHEQLIMLNREVVARVKQLNILKAQSELQRFRIGNQVKFITSEGELVIGTIVRINKKTVSMVTDDGHRWKVSPSLLTKLSSAAPAPAEQGVIELFD